MWNLKCKIRPVIIRASGIVTDGLRENFEAIPGKHTIDSLQETVLLGTSHVIRKELLSEWWGSPLIQEKYMEEKTCDKRQQQQSNNDDNNNNNNNNAFKDLGLVVHSGLSKQLLLLFSRLYNVSTSSCAHLPCSLILPYQGLEEENLDQK